MERALRAKFDDTLALFEEVDYFHFETGNDSTGDPAVWVWIVIRDEAPESFWSAEGNERRHDIRDSIRDAVASMDLDLWPYIRFRQASEERELREAS